MALTITYRTSAGEFSKAMAGIVEPIAAAATGAMRDAQDTIKREGRAEMAGAGMSSRFQNGFRVDLYPRSGQSTSAAVHAYHKFSFAGVFEEGATITGSPLLWVPIAENLPKKDGRPVGIREFRRSGQRMVTMRRRGGSGPPVLGAPIGPDGKLLPVFVGVPSVQIGKKFDIAGVMDRTASQIEQLYSKNLKV